MEQKEILERARELKAESIEHNLKAYEARQQLLVKLKDPELLALMVTATQEGLSCIDKRDRALELLEGYVREQHN